MRNRTAIRLLILLAVFAAIVPPLVMLGYARRLGVTQIGRELEFISDGAVSRSESIVESVLASLDEISTTPSEPQILRGAVFRNPFLKAIIVRRGDTVVSSTSQIDLETLAIGSLPAPGQFRIHGPLSNGLPSSSLVLIDRPSEDLVLIALMHPAVFTEFFHQQAVEAEARAFIFLGGDAPAVMFGATDIDLSADVKAHGETGLRQPAGALASVSASEKYPIRSAVVAGVSSVDAKWASSGPRFVIAGGLISLVLCWLVLRAARRMSTLEAELREAIKFGELSVYYQPLVDLDTNRCLGAEALMRWRHPQRGMQRAAEFIDVAERTRLILPMTDKVIETVASDFESLIHEDPTLHVAINLAPQHFSNTRILGTVRTAFNGIAKNVIFEITERSLVAGSDSVARTVMDGLTECGAKLAVDDFGTGYSNLSYLQRFPVDFLKIDKSFVDEIKNDDSSAALVDQVIRIGKMLNMEIIAEGVEHASQAAYLRKEGVHMAQGWFFGEPMPIEEFRQFVALHNTGVPSLN